MLSPSKEKLRSMVIFPSLERRLNGKHYAYESKEENICALHGCNRMTKFKCSASDCGLFLCPMYSENFDFFDALLLKGQISVDAELFRNQLLKTCFILVHSMLLPQEVKMLAL